MHPGHSLHAHVIWQSQAMPSGRRQQFGTESKGEIQDMAKARNPAGIAIRNWQRNFFFFFFFVSNDSFLISQFR